MFERFDLRGGDREAAVERAVRALREGQLVVLPTDTVYGVAVNAFDPTATALARVTVGREDVPLSVMVRSPKQLVGFTTVVPATADRLVAAFWPGPLTLVLGTDAGLRWDLGPSDGAVAVRMPLDDVVLELIRAVGPLAVTTAARAGDLAPTEVDDAQVSLGDAVAVYLDDGPRHGPVSTIVDLTRPTPHVLRSGAIPDDLAIAVALGEVDPFEAAAQLEDTGDEPTADDQPVTGDGPGSASA